MSKVCYTQLTTRIEKQGHDLKDAITQMDLAIQENNEHYMQLEIKVLQDIKDNKDYTDQLETKYAKVQEQMDRIQHQLIPHLEEHLQDYNKTKEKVQQIENKLKTTTGKLLRLVRTMITTYEGPAPPSLFQMMSDLRKLEQEMFHGQ